MKIAHDRVRVEVPATSANLGPAFDCAGMALGLVDEIEIEAVAGGVEVTVSGEGAGQVGQGEDHLVVRALRMGLEYAGAPQVGLRMRCLNRIPHGRGLGSSAAAVVGGLLLARGLVAEESTLDDQVLLDLATQLEGHPDNAAPALLGGVTIAWRSGGRARAVQLDIPADSPVNPVVLSPSSQLATERARGLLPAEVPFADASHAAGRSALLVHALTCDPSLLLEATQDHLHQERRAPAMPESVELVRVLRQEGYPATISGAGPSVIVLAGADRRMCDVVRGIVSDPGSWRTARVGLRRRGGELSRPNAGADAVLA